MAKFIKPFVVSIHGTNDFYSDKDGVTRINQEMNRDVNKELLINIDMIGFIKPRNDLETIIYSKGYVNHDGGNDYFDGTFWLTYGSADEINKMIEDAING